MYEQQQWPTQLGLSVGIAKGHCHSRKMMTVCTYVYALLDLLKHFLLRWFGLGQIVFLCGERRRTF
jgi:hypothetical protein